MLRSMGTNCGSFSPSPFLPTNYAKAEASMVPQAAESPVLPLVNALLVEKATHRAWNGDGLKTKIKKN